MKCIIIFDHFLFLIFFQIQTWLHRQNFIMKTMFDFLSYCHLITKAAALTEQRGWHRPRLMIHWSKHTHWWSATRDLEPGRRWRTNVIQSISRWGHQTNYYFFEQIFVAIDKLKYMTTPRGFFGDRYHGWYGKIVRIQNKITTLWIDCSVMGGKYCDVKINTGAWMSWIGIGGSMALDWFVIWSNYLGRFFEEARYIGSDDLFKRSKCGLTFKQLRIRHSPKKERKKTEDPQSLN